MGRPTLSRMIYFYPRPPRGGRLCILSESFQHHRISIHALREEGDEREVKPYERQYISIHALREEGDAEAFNYMAMAG